MARWTLCLAAVAALLPGCLFVTQPLSDPDKAEPEKRLLGKWEGPGGRLQEIDCPAVKGNPKGLMRYREAQDAFWFFTTTIGKHTYLTIFLDRQDKPADFGQEGAFEKWNKRDGRLYMVNLYVLEGDRLTLRAGSADAGKLMRAELIPAVEGEGQIAPYFKTPPGWLAKYLEQHGPEKLFGEPAEPWLRAESAEAKRRKQAERAEAERWMQAERAEAERRMQAESVTEADREAERRRQAESFAGELVKSAKIFIAGGATATARRRLEKVIKDYGDTEAASEAKEMLKKLNE
jgi:hypothetical protein